jgi:hypothetical protein
MCVILVSIFNSSFTASTVAPTAAAKNDVWFESSQVNILPKAKSQVKDKRAKDRQ